MSGSYAVTEVFLKTFSRFDDSKEEFRGKTPLSDYETKRTTSQFVQKLGDGFQEKLKASRSVIQGLYNI